MTKKGTKKEPTDEELDDYINSNLESEAEVKREEEAIKRHFTDTPTVPTNIDIYLVGYHYGHDDQWEHFKAKGEWEHGRDESITLVESVKPGSFLILKTTATKGNILYLDGLGVVEQNPENGFSLKVNWIIPKEEFKRGVLPGLSAAFPRTIQKVGNKYRSLIFKTVGTDSLSKALNLSKESNFAGLTIISESGEVYLNADVIAEEFANVIHRSKEINQTEKGRTSQEDRFYGIFGQWGRGKTKFWTLVKYSLDGLKGYRFIDFHAWKYQETPAVWAYLYEKFADEYYFKSKFYPLTYFVNLFQSFWLSVFRNPGSVTLFFMSLVGTVWILMIDFLQLTSLEWYELTGASIAGLVGLISTYKTFSKPLAARATSFVTLAIRKNFKTHLGVQHEAQEELRILLKAWYFLYIRKKNIVLFIDDIDRCDEKKIIQIVDSIRVMLNEPEIQKRLIVIAAIDERILCQAIRKKYEGFVGKDIEGLDIERLTAEYLDKLFIAGIKLNDLTGTEKQNILEGYAKGITQEIIGKEDNVTTAKNMGASNKSDIENQTEEEDQQGPNSNPDPPVSYELAFEEKEMLVKQILGLEKATPRSIRGFLIRYRLARNLAAILEPPSQILSRLEENKSIAEYIIDSMNFKPSTYSTNSNLIKREDVIKSIVAMVDYYHHPSTSSN